MIICNNDSLVLLEYSRIRKRQDMTKTPIKKGKKILAAWQQKRHNFILRVNRSVSASRIVPLRFFHMHEGRYPFKFLPPEERIGYLDKHHPCGIYKKPPI